MTHITTHVLDLASGAPHLVCACGSNGSIRGVVGEQTTDEDGRVRGLTTAGLNRYATG